MEPLWRRWLRYAQREYSARQRLLALSITTPLFVIVIPVLEVYVSRWLDRAFGLPTFGCLFLEVFGGVVAVGGWVLSFWSVYTQFTLGRGTPIPWMPPQRLVIQGPYRYVRNPMALGNILMYLGIALVLGSISAMVLVLVGGTLLLLYDKVVEEREMALRFGEEYLEYKRRTPFIIPRFKGR